MENPGIAVFVETQHEEKLGRGAKIMPDGDLRYTTYHPFSMQL
jgi:hypothetical protein